jgi:Fusaric acid resistance protein family
MAGAFSPLPLRSWLQRKPDWLDHQTVAALIFALKTFAAAILALFIAFWAGLDEPRWAFLTVFVVAQPNGGLVLAKSFYRILGTIAGVLVTIALAFGLAQYGELFVAMSATSTLRVSGFANPWRHSIGATNCLSRRSPAGFGRIRSRPCWPVCAPRSQSGSRPRSGSRSPFADFNPARCSRLSQLRYGYLLSLFALDQECPRPRRCRLGCPGRIWLR